MFIFFSALQFLCLLLYVQFVSFPKSIYLSTASTLNGKIQFVEGKLTNHFDLEENNAALRWENAQLRRRVFTNFYRVERTKTQVNDTAYEQSFSFIPTKIINASVGRRNNYFTIDVGEQQGIKKNMGVISPKGVVGIVFKVGEHFSLVKSILTQDINLDIMI